MVHFYFAGFHSYSRFDTTSEDLELGTTEKSEYAAFLGEGYVIKITFPSPPIVLCF